MVVLLLLVTVGCVLIGWLVPLAFKSKRPFGLTGDILGATIAGVVWAIVLYQVLAPMVGMSGPLAFFGSALEAMAVGAVMLWLLRKIKK